ncbi:hypothetical protein GCM10020254_09390 [Streptomyces goshikiensis]
MFALFADPAVTASCRASVTALAALADIARSGFGATSGIVAPLRVMERTEYGSVCMPLAAKVPYALAMRIALGIEFSPSAKPGTLGPRLEFRNPERWAKSCARSRPTSRPSCSIGVLMESATAWRRVTWPQLRSPSLFPFTTLPLRSQYGPSGVCTVTLSLPS